MRGTISQNPTEVIQFCYKGANFLSKQEYTDVYIQEAQRFVSKGKKFSWISFLLKLKIRNISFAIISEDHTSEYAIENQRFLQFWKAYLHEITWEELSVSHHIIHHTEYLLFAFIISSDNFLIPLALRL